MSAATATVSSCTAANSPAPYLFAAASVWNLPIGSGATWQSNTQLSGAPISFNTSATGYNEPIYKSTASDPLVTITNSGTAIAQPPGTYQAHIPAGAQASQGSDEILSVDDTSTGTWYSFGGFVYTGSNTANSSAARCRDSLDSGAKCNGSMRSGFGRLCQAL
jgi:hypothetical protein